MTGTSLPKRSGSTTGSVYGFGSASLRFQNEVYDSHLTFGKANKAVVELEDSSLVDVTQMAATAPSRQLPAYAATFKPESGRTFATTMNRDAPPGSSGQCRFWVQPKDTGGLFPDGDGVPAPFPMEAPRGAGPPARLHDAPKELLTPAERREALVFDKCHERARKTLRKAAQDACNLTHQMHTRYPHGVMGVEGPDCPDSLVYADRRVAREAKEASRKHHAAGRLANIAARRDTPLDYQLTTYDPASTAVETMFARKGGSSLGIRGASTIADPAASYVMRPQESSIREFAFRSNLEQPLRPVNPLRTERLHNIHTRGKPYDIISGAAPSVQPTAADATIIEHDRRAHPSNISIPHCGGTAPTLIGPIPDAHASSWQPPSPTKARSSSFLR